VRPGGVESEASTCVRVLSSCVSVRVSLIDTLDKYGGFVPMLYDVLTELGIPTEPIHYVCRGEAGPDGQLQGHIVINPTVPASATLPLVAAF